MSSLAFLASTSGVRGKELHACGGQVRMLAVQSSATEREGNPFSYAMRDRERARTGKVLDKFACHLNLQQIVLPFSDTHVQFLVSLVCRSS